jgi:integrase
MATTARGHIERLPSGSFRVHVYAGTDPVTGKPRRLKQTCPDEATAAAALGQLLGQADGDRFPSRQATLAQALDKYLEVADLELSTKEAHEGYNRRTIKPGPALCIRNTGMARARLKENTLARIP